MWSSGETIICVFAPFIIIAVDSSSSSSSCSLVYRTVSFVLSFVRCVLCLFLKKVFEASFDTLNI